MSNTTELRERIFVAITSLLNDKRLKVSDDTQLIGDGTVLDSMKLIELCLSLEDIAMGLDFEFDWTSDTAMSRSRSMFRTAGSLATEFISQMESQQ